MVDRNDFSNKSSLVPPYLIGNSHAIKELRRDIKKISNTDVTVLLLGDTGTGKSVLALSMHNNSVRRNRPFVKVNCANIPRLLIESELFGYKHGSFTGAWKDKLGKFELAKNGTVFLDEISELSLDMQSKLLQVLQDNEFTPIGGLEPTKVNVRIIAATNSRLERLISAGKFRLDLYYRLAVLCFHLPSLKERKEDVLPLTQFFLDKYTRLYKKNKTYPSASFLELLKFYDWPGNVRELENIIKSYVVLESEDVALEGIKNKIDLYSDHKKRGDKDVSSKTNYSISLREATRRERENAERNIIQKALKKAQGDKKKTADLLQVSYKCILNKIKLYRL